MRFFEQFGGRVNKELIEQYNKSPNWRDGKFQNLVETDMNMRFSDIMNLLYTQIVGIKDKMPNKRLPIAPFDKAAFLADSPKAKFIWFGHSVLLFRINGKTIFIDPMMGPSAAPIAPSGPRRFSDNTLEILDELPEIDLLILSHDHYDHIDLRSILKLKDKTKSFFVALGVKRHLLRWGVAPDIITEFDWWDHQTYAGINITFTPTRHFTGRGLRDRFKSLWGGWVLKTRTENIWFSGDGGYSTHFKEIGKRLGPFDFGFMECGQYNKKWPLIHLFPDESIQAALDANARKVMPVHWGGFALSQHTWIEPVEWFTSEAEKNALTYSVPKLGELIQVDDTCTETWWTD